MLRASAPTALRASAPRLIGGTHPPCRSQFALLPAPSARSLNLRVSDCFRSHRINAGCVSGLVTYLKNSDDNVVCMAAQAMQFLSSNADNIATLRVQPGLIANLVRWTPSHARTKTVSVQ